jgi:hypothetical protein
LGGSDAISRRFRRWAESTDIRPANRVRRGLGGVGVKRGRISGATRFFDNRNRFARHLFNSRITSRTLVGVPVPRLKSARALGSFSLSKTAMWARLEVVDVDVIAQTGAVGVG